MTTSREAGSSHTEKLAPVVLVIDDEASIRTTLRRYFARRRIEVDEAGDGAAALEKLLGADARDYAAIILDLRLPGMSGIDIYRRLASERPELARRLVFSTGDATSPEVSGFLRDSGCPVMEKPFELAELGRTVERLASG
jgi:DNA-binding response OmpR family regulator